MPGPLHHQRMGRLFVKIQSRLVRRVGSDQDLPRDVAASSPLDMAVDDCGQSVAALINLDVVEGVDAAIERRL